MQCNVELVGFMGCSFLLCDSVLVEPLIDRAFDCF